MSQDLQHSTASMSQSVETINVQDDFGLVQIDSNTYTGKRPLMKPSTRHRGVYGGNLVAQGLLVAMTSVGLNEYAPHSLHSYFVRPVTDLQPITWKVEEVSNGKNYSNRLVKGFQNDKIVYTTNISLIKKDGIKKDSFEFEKRPHPQLQRNDKLLNFRGNDRIKIDSKKFEYDESKDSFCWVMKYGIEDEQAIRGVDEAYKYIILALMTDWKNLEMILKNNNLINNGANEYSLMHPKFNVSLDHTIYFHDGEFDPTKWMGIEAKCTRISHDRALIIAEVYSETNGKHVATIVQERLYVIKDETAKI